MSDNFNPDEFIGQASPEAAPQGFNPDTFAKDELQQQQYGTPEQQGKAAVEGLAKGVAGPLATLAETKLLGVKPEDIEGRASANPITHFGSEAAGLVGGAVLPGLGEYSQASALGKAGQAVSEGLGLEGAAAGAAKMGIENALYTIGDETSKALLNNPASIQTAAAHVGLSGLLGAGIGAGLGRVSDLWKSKVGPEADQFVTDFSERLKYPDMEFGGKLSPGMKAADGLVKQASKAAAETLGGGTGAIAGKLSGIPGGGYLGGLFGHYAITPLLKTFLPSIIEPLLKSKGSGEGLMAAFDGMNAVLKGDSLLNDSAKALFQTGTTTTLNDLIPKKDQLDKLKEGLSAVDKAPESIMDVGGSLSHYMPGHATALTATAQGAINYLKSQAPQSVQPGVLDRKIAPSAQSVNNFKDALEIAESPLSIISHVKNGSLSASQVAHLKALYPALFPQVVQSVTNAMLEHLSGDGQVPYSLRKGLSRLIGQPMDSTFSPASMQAAQATFTPPQKPQGEQPVKKGTKALSKTAELHQNPSEARQKALNKA